MFGVGGPRGRDCPTFSTREAIRTALGLVFSVNCFVGDVSPSSQVLCTIEALLSVRLKGL
jgi:hypothetical protein